MCLRSNNLIEFNIRVILISSIVYDYVTYTQRLRDVYVCVLDSGAEYKLIYIFTTNVLLALPV